jgi:hypothetical protein
MSALQELTFQEWPKIARLNRRCVITEKIDGTNAQVHVLDDGRILAGSRNRYLFVDADNFGFARWVAEHEKELLKLGPGRHFGEWWGPGIQRGYGLREKKFSLFNTTRWADASVRPACCDVVPIIFDGAFSTLTVEYALSLLREKGSFASPGFMRPEGVVVFHTSANQMFKVTLENDAEPKGKVQ